MAIIHDSRNQTITLHTDHTTYQMKIGPCDMLVHTYYGPRTEGDMSYCLSFMDRGFSGNPYEAGMDRTISADTLPMEYPCEGSGDFRATALSVRRENGVSGCDLRFQSMEILQGKEKIPGLPSVHADKEDVQTLFVTLADASTGLQVVLQYNVFPKLDVITRSACITNSGNETLTLQNAASTVLDLVSGQWELIHFHGRHMGERNTERLPLGHQETVVGSRRGTSSHQQNPFAILAQPETTERSGQCYAVQLLYSGSFACNASVEEFGSTRLVMGVQPERFDYELAPVETFQTPEAAMVYSDQGLAHMSHLLHHMIRKHVCRGPWRDRQRPVLINNWEATYMDFDGDKILNIARQARELGVEMMVLDDGWFGARNDDNAGLGDWVVNTKKMGGTMGDLARKIRAMDMKFGIWIEPEMVNEDSDRYRQHPDWALQIPGKKPVRSRNQLVLDFSRAEVVDGIFDQLAVVLDECQPDYVKMDMNRSICDVYNATMGHQSQGKVLYHYVLGVYRFMEKMLERYPDLLLEGCSGGGGRFDAGMLYYCPQIWTSDNTDAINRLDIQYGTSFGYPVSTMGAHVSAVPNHETGRVTDIHTRAVVAMSGTFGYELDLNLISEEEKKAVTEQIKTFHKYWELIQNGTYYRLTDLQKNRQEAAWMMVAQDKTEALVNIVTMDVAANGPNRFVYCMGLEPGAIYMDADSGICYPANALMTQGLPMPTRIDPLRGVKARPTEYQAFQIHLVKQ